MFSGSVERISGIKSDNVLKLAINNQSNQSKHLPGVFLSNTESSISIVHFECVISLYLKELYSISMTCQLSSCINFNLGGNDVFKDNNKNIRLNSEACSKKFFEKF